MSELNEKLVKARLVHKHDIAANWERAVNFVPKQGEIIVYDNRYIDKETQEEVILQEPVRYKIGDGVTNVSELPFMSPVYQGNAAGSAVIGTDNEAIGTNSTSEGANNKSRANNSHTEGDSNTTGCRGFNILAIDPVGYDSTETAPTEMHLTLDSVEGLAIDDSCSVAINKNYMEMGKITNISENTITINAYPDDLTAAIISTTVVGGGEELAYVFVSTKQTIGTTIFDSAQHAEGYETAALMIASHAEGAATVASGKYSHAEGDSTFAGYAAHAEGQKTKALGGISHAEGSDTTASGVNSHAEGQLSTASGRHSHAEGYQTTAEGKRAHSEGYKTSATGTDSHSEGNLTTASGEQSHAEGQGTTASGWVAHAEGYKTSATENKSHAEGDNTAANAEASHAEGHNTVASGYASHAEGFGSNLSEGLLTQATATAAHAEGKDTCASAEAAHAEGHATVANGKGSHSEGFSEGDAITTASGQGAHAEGTGSVASGHAAHAEGVNTVASDYAAHAEGSRTTASGLVAHAEGSGTTASGSTSHAEGGSTLAKGYQSHAEGGSTKAYAKNSHAEGSGTTTGSSTDADSAEGAHAEGRYSTASGQAAHAEGNNTLAKGYHSHAEGMGSKAYGHRSHAEGNGTTAGIDGQASNTDGAHAEGISTTASGKAAHAEGSSTQASGNQAHAEGSSTQASGNQAHAEGRDTTASGDSAHAEGDGTTASGWVAHAEGMSTTASGSHAHAEGRSTTASGYYAHAEGDGTTASGWVAHAEGDGTTASGSHAHAEGESTKAYAKNSHAEGLSTTTGSSTDADSAECAHAEGVNTVASGYAAHAEGDGTTASGSDSHAEGNGTTASELCAHAEGNGTTASGLCAHAEGSQTTASGLCAHAEGNTTTASGKYSHAEGNKNTANAEAAHAEGKGTTASGKYSHAEGCSTTASGLYSHAEGSDTTASGQDAHAEGSSTTAGAQAHAEGFNTTASGQAAHAEGYSTTASAYVAHAEGDSTLAKGRGSHAEGYSTTASGHRAHAEGKGTTASGESSHAEGCGTIADGNIQHVQGKYNVPDSNMAHIVGNGNSDTDRKNIHTLDWDGNAWFAGDVFVGKNNEKLVTDSKVTSIQDTVNTAHTELTELEKRVNIIETAAEGSIYDVVTDTTTAYKKVVPSNTLPYAMIDRIGGAVSVSPDSVRTFPYIYGIDNRDDGISVQQDGDSFIFSGISGDGEVTVWIYDAASAPDYVEKGEYEFVLKYADGSARTMWKASLEIYDRDNNFNAVANEHLNGYTDVSIPFSIPESKEYILILWFTLPAAMGDIGTVTVTPMFVRKGGEITKSPVTAIVGRQTYNIPEAIKTINGYGLGISDSLYNYIDFKEKKFVRMVAERPFQDGDTNNDTTLTDGKTTIYALSTVETVDISDKLTFDGNIEVEAGKFIVAENTLAFDVPSTVTFTVKEDNFASKQYVNDLADTKLDIKEPSLANISGVTTYIKRLNSETGETYYEQSFKRIIDGRGSVIAFNLPTYMPNTAIYGADPITNGAVLLSGEPKLPVHVATKNYVDKADNVIKRDVQNLKYQMSNMENMASGKLYNFTYDIVTGKTWTPPKEGLSYVAPYIKVLELYGRKVDNLVVNRTLDLATGELYNYESLTVTSDGRTLTFNGTASAYTSFVVFGTGGDPDATYGIKTTPSGTCSSATPFVFVNQRWGGMPVSSVLDSFVISTTDVVCFKYHETFEIALANGWEPDGYLFGGETILRINEGTTFDNFTLTFEFGTITAEENYIVKPQSIYATNSKGETNELVVPEEVRQLACYGLPKNYYNFNTGVYYQAQDLVDGEIVDLETPIQHTGYELNPWLNTSYNAYVGVVTEPANEMAKFKLYYQKKLS